MMEGPVQRISVIPQVTGQLVQVAKTITMGHATTVGRVPSTLVFQVMPQRTPSLGVSTTIKIVPAMTALLVRLIPATQPTPLLKTAA
jgi:hypothetical protein